METGSIIQIHSDPPPLWVDEHGAVRVAGSRVLLDIVIGRFKAGDRPDEIVSSFPTLSLALVYATIAYYLRHQAEIDAYLAENERRAAELRRTIESEFPPRVTRDQLIARMQERTTRT